MGSLNDRLRALEQAQPAYPEHVVRAAMGRLRTEELKSYITAMERALEGSAPDEGARLAVTHINKLCQEIKMEGVF